MGRPRKEPCASSQPSARSQAQVSASSNALRDDAQVEVASQVGDRPHDEGVPVVGHHVGDERTVDLEMVDRQPAQVPERAGARSDVVERQRDASEVATARRRSLVNLRRSSEEVHRPSGTA